MADEKIVSDERLYDYLRTYAKTMKLSDSKFHITEGSNKGDNYVGLVYRVTIETIENGEVKKIQLILKTTKTSYNQILTRSGVTKMFQREIFFYREVLPIFKETLKEYGENIDRFPILYDVNDESGKEILMLEDLTPQGFVMSKSKTLDYPHLSLAIQSLGEFHAYSFITRAANPTSFEKLRRIEEIAFTQHLLDNESKSDNENKSYTNSIKMPNIILKVLANEGKHYSERYQRFLDNMIRNMIDAVDGKAAEPYAVVNHGDSWTNNILFKYDQEKNPYDLRFIDLQLCRYASPVLDLVYLLFCCCTQEIRSKYFDQVIHDYYEALSKCIKKAGYDPNILFPREVLSEHFIKFGKYAAGMVTFTLHIFIGNADLKDAFDKSDTLQDKVQNDSFFRNTMTAAFKDLVDRNYI